MYLIDDIDFILSLIRLKASFFYEFADILDAIIRCTIDLDDIEHGFIISRETVRAGMAGIPIFRARTVQGFCEDTGTRRLSSSTRSMKEVRMMDASCSEAISENGRDVLLSDDRVPVTGPVFIIERHVPGG